MKIWSRDFTRREKATLFGLLILLIGILYFQCVDRPVRTSINAAKAEALEIETEMSVVAAKVRQLTKMQNELDDVKGSGVLSRMESYNNSSAEISFLYDILAETQQYNIEFSDITRNGDQIRRNFSLKFRTRDYDAMRNVITRLCASEYRCLVDEIRCQRTINERESYVTANVTATFYETMVGGKPDAGLPKDSAVPDTETR